MIWFGLYLLCGAVVYFRTVLKYSGRIRVGDKDYDAISEDGVIDDKERVAIVRISMGTPVVRRLQQNRHHSSDQRDLTPQF